MKRIAVALLFLIAIAGGIVLLATPGAEASPGATITVNSTGDSDSRDGVITLREAMLLATGALAVGTLNKGECDQVSNSSWNGSCSTTDSMGAASADIIAFDATVFPPTTPATISLTSTLPTLSTGSDTISGAGAGVIVDGVNKTFDCFLMPGEDSDNNTVRGLQVSRCSTGVRIEGGADDTVVGGSTASQRNVISGNATGVLISGTGTNGNTVSGNYIGINAVGSSAVANEYGVVVGDGAQNNVIGGPAEGQRNIISGNSIRGVRIFGVGTSSNVVKGNYIGTNPAGSSAIPNLTGVEIFPYAQNNTIGGTIEGELNVISGNSITGVLIELASDNVVMGNYIGTNAAGDEPIPNDYGVAIQADSNTVGGSAADERNVISGNRVAISIFNAAGNVVKGNYIGTNAAGTAGIPNTYGVSIWGGAHNNTIGGTSPGEGNVIAFNTNYGVSGGDGAANTVRGNSIHSNGGKGISYEVLAPPVVDSVGSASGHTEPKCYPCTVEVFSDDEDEGRVYHGFTTTNDDATGTWTYPGSVTGPNVTATITDADGSTSEFSVPVAYSPPAVGGIAELPDIAQDSVNEADLPVDSFSPSAPPYIPLAATVASLIALTAGAWYARRRGRG